MPAYRDDGGSVRLGLDARYRGFDLPCGRCVGCKSDRARTWSVRITHEAQLWDSNYFATFTYRDEALAAKPFAGKSLDYVDFQQFLYRLRYHYKGDKVAPNGHRAIRFFVAGEYGEKTLRPHFHAILFNVAFPDVKPWGKDTVHSPRLEEVWGLGGVLLGSVTPRSAAYVAGYVNKKRFGQSALSHYQEVDAVTGELVLERRPEFVQMSLRPGIGGWWYDRFSGDLFPHDFAVQEGKRYKVPRYYSDKWMAELPYGPLEEGQRRVDRGLVERVKEARLDRAELAAEDGSPERLAVREEVAAARLSFFGARDF